MRRTPRRRALVLAVGSLLMAPRAARAQQARPRIVASFSILGDVTRAIVPSDFEVIALVGPDSDPHAFDPSPSDVRRIKGAELVVVNGLGYEGWLDRVVKASGFQGPVCVASRDVDVRYTMYGTADPHAWNDLRQGRRYVENIADAVSTRWPLRRGEVFARADSYLGEVDALDRRVRQMMNAIPVERRRVITSHDAFGYFGDAYGVTFFPLQGFGPGAEPAAGTVARLLAQIREQRIHALFVGNIGNRKLVEQIARDAGARLGGTLYSDALSVGGGPAATYLALLEHNARTLAGALGSPL